MSKREISEREFEAFCMAHWRRLVAALASSLPSEEDPADVAQEAFARAYCQLEVRRVLRASRRVVVSHRLPLGKQCATET